jgi:hypothetical protein
MDLEDVVKLVVLFPTLYPSIGVGDNILQSYLMLWIHFYMK